MEPSPADRHLIFLYIWWRRNEWVSRSVSIPESECHQCYQHSNISLFPV